MPVYGFLQMLNHNLRIITFFVHGKSGYCSIAIPFNIRQRFKIDYRIGAVVFPEVVMRIFH